jgi:hypothetical protein
VYGELRESVVVFVLFDGLPWAYHYTSEMMLEKPASNRPILQEWERQGVSRSDIA